MKGVSNKQLEEMRKSPCWEWPGTVKELGYARRMKDGVQLVVHRAIYETLIEDIPKDLVCDHLCRNRKCVNPFHLDIVTNKENILRGTGFSAANASKTHCYRGHALKGENLYTTQRGYRACKKCHNIRQNARRKKIREADTIKQHITSVTGVE